MANRCEIKWCKHVTSDPIYVNEIIGDGAFRTKICRCCADALGIVEGGTLPESEQVRKAVKAYDKKQITVCAECLRACCWQGELMCDGATTADVIDKSIKELKKLNLEHSDYWREH